MLFTATEGQIVRTSTFLNEYTRRVADSALWLDKRVLVRILFLGLALVSIGIPLVFVWLLLHQGMLSFVTPFGAMVIVNALVLFMLAYFVRRWQRAENQSQVALALNEKRYRITSEMTSDYTYYHRVQDGAALERVWISGAFEHVTGYSASDLIDDNTAMIYHPDDVARANADRACVIAGDAIEAEYRIFRPDDQLRWLRIVRVPDWDEKHERVIGYYGVAIDITEHKVAEDERLQLALRQQQFSVMSSFVRAISHDFRNRLSTIESNRHIITRIVDDTTREKVTPRLENIRHAMQGIMEQLDNLTVVAGLGSQTKDLVDLNLLLKHVVNRYLSRAFEKHLTLRLEGSDILCFEMDEGQMERVLHHLVINALAHTQAGGEIVVRSYREGDNAIIEVADSGEGIASDELERVFEPFYRGDEARTINEAGLGVGLTIARLIVEAHQGCISVHSRLGRGTTFRIALPMKS
jgi:two-component system, chemotaxis family, CheB/CheR fusion protein